MDKEENNQSENIKKLDDVISKINFSNISSNVNSKNESSFNVHNNEDKNPKNPNDFSIDNEKLFDDNKMIKSDALDNSIVFDDKTEIKQDYEDNKCFNDKNNFNNTLIQQSNLNNNNYSNNNIKRKMYISYEKRFTFLALFSLIFVITFIILLFKTISFVKNNKEYYSENSQSSYSVCLSENKYYEESCLSENREYLSSIVEKIPFTFSYNSFYENVIKKTFNYRVDGHLKIFSQDNESQVLYEKIYNILDNQQIELKSNTFSIADSVIIPFKEYNDLASRYSNDFGLLSNSELTVEFYVNDNAVSTLTIPLNKQTFSILKSDMENNVSVDVDLKERINNNTLILLILLVILGVLSLIFVILLLRFIFKYSKHDSSDSKYHNEVKNLLKNYDRIIVEVRNVGNLLDNKTIIKVDSFLELVDVRDTLDKPIIHIRINNIKDGFYVEDHDKIYSFVMKSK